MPVRDPKESSGCWISGISFLQRGGLDKEPLIKIKISPHLLGVKECSDASLLGVIVEDQKRGLI
jgi:hypothetical protein